MVNSSLATQIEQAGQQVLKRQQQVNRDAGSLAHKLSDNLASPANLILASGIGFILGELTHRQTCNCADANLTSDAAGTSPLRSALNIVSLANTLYTALAFIWIKR